MLGGCARRLSTQAVRGGFQHACFVDDSFAWRTQPRTIVVTWGKLAATRHANMLQNILHTLERTVRKRSTSQADPHAVSLYAYLAGIDSRVCRQHAHDDDKEISATAAQQQIALPSSFRRIESDVRRAVEFDWNSVDLLVAIGGDGLVLHLCRDVFKRARIPKLAAFDVGGNTGFLVPFRADDFEHHIERILNNESGLMVTTRERLFCRVLRKKHIQNRTDNENDKVEELDWFLALNEAVLERGLLPKVCEVDVYASGKYVTRLRADGVVVASPTGSSAYSLAAGGSLVHPGLSALLLTPVSAQSLASRPAIFPRSASLDLVPTSSTSELGGLYFRADGGTIRTLDSDQAARIQISKWPLVAFTPSNSTSDWVSGISGSLRWNVRLEQKPPLSPRSSKGR